MNFIIADTFQTSLARLARDEQRVVKTTVYDLQVKPDSPGHRYHRLDRARDRRFWSVSASMDLRIIVHRGENSLLVCYVDHHDKAYAWAECRKIKTHPHTGAAQMVKIRELALDLPASVSAPAVAREAASAPAASPAVVRPFVNVSEERLLAYGVPPEWIGDVRQVALGEVEHLVEHLPAEAAEALLDLATGGNPPVPEVREVEQDPYAHPDAQRRFRSMATPEALQRALDAPWEKWAVFLHPDQQQWVTKTFTGPARISGSAGTGKTVVALHRAVHLARANPEARVVLTTFSEVLARALADRVRVLVAQEPRIAERLEVQDIDALGRRMYKARFGTLRLADQRWVARQLDEASAAVPGHRFPQRFIRTEWEQVVDTWQCLTWDAYRDVARLGRRTRLPEAQRRVLWQIFEAVIARMQSEGVVTMHRVFTRLAEDADASGRAPFDHVVVDEAQDLSVSQLRFLGAVCGRNPEGLFFAGDQGQRIFQPPFSWLSLGIDIRGRSRTLKVNYRTSHQIRSQADLLLGEVVADVDGIEDQRRTVSVFNGPAPLISLHPTEEAEAKAVAAWVRQRLHEGIASEEIALIFRSVGQMNRAREAARIAGVGLCLLDDESVAPRGQILACTMHRAKGLEFRAVAVIACDDEILPLDERLAAAADHNEIEEINESERHLLYVACTRARDHLLVSAMAPGSAYLEDMGGR